MPATIPKTKKQEVAFLKAQGYSPTKISRDTGLHHKTVGKLLQDSETLALVADAQTRIGLKFEALCEKVLDSVSEDDLLKASLQQKSIAAATMLDKSRLVQGRATSISIQQVFNIAVKAADDSRLIDITCDTPDDI